MIIVVVIAVLIWSMYLIYKKRLLKDILKVITIGALLIILYSILTYGRTVIHSDIATAILLKESILRHKNLFPLSFNYANGDIWFLTLHLLCIIPSIFTNDQSLIRMLASAQMVLLATSGLVLLSKKIFKDNSWTISIPVIFLCITGERSMLIYEAGYTSLVLWLTLIPTLFYYASKKKINNTVAYIIIFVCLIVASPVRYAAELVLPIILAVCISDYLKKKNNFEFKDLYPIFYNISFLIFAPMIIGTLGYYWICSCHNVNNTVNNSTVYAGSIQDLWNNVLTAMFDIFSCFGYSGGVKLLSLNGMVNLISLSMGLLTCYIIPLLQIRKCKDETEEAVFYITFGLIHNIVITLVCVLFGQVNTPRYMLTVVIVSIIISSRYIYKYWINEDFISKIIVLVFCLCLIVQASFLSYYSENWHIKLQDQKALSDYLKSEGLKKGYATYWNAYNNEVYSDMEVKFGAINIVVGGISPFYWLVDSEVYEVDNTETFLMLTNAEKESLDFNIISTFGVPVEELNYGDYNIWVFDHDISAEMIR